MKGLNVLVAFLGGAAVGAAVGDAGFGLCMFLSSRMILD